jgi:rhamnose utilization protein RhaD (predicted bifunctional aldolase and dehydrogenase)
MSESVFIVENRSALADFVALSAAGGSRSDYVQGGGGNTSCKLYGSLMAIKASGFRLSQVAMDNAYAVLDFGAIRQFYAGNRPEELADVEASGSAAARAATQTVAGLPVLRPSVEAGFHSLMQRFVLHTHPVYANLAACSADAPAILDAALAGEPYAWGYVPYINPGAQLTFALAAEIDRVERTTGKKPQVILMQNHGLIATADEWKACLEIHDRANERLAQAYGVRATDWPAIAVQALTETGAALAGTSDAGAAVIGSSCAGSYASATPWLTERLKGSNYPVEFFTVDALYPDQLVFLAGNLAIREAGRAADISMAELTAKCTIFRETGEILYRCTLNEAQTIEETLCAILFITQGISAAGRRLMTMSESGKDFIAGWESEKYRKSLAGK